MKRVITISESHYSVLKQLSGLGAYHRIVLQSFPLEDVLDDLKTEITNKVLESLSDGGDDWFAAEKVNQCLDIIDEYKKGIMDTEGDQNGQDC